MASLGCATYQSELQKSISDLKEGHPEIDAEALKTKAYTDGDDQGVYLLEYGTAQQLAKNYEESNRALLKAEELTDVKDYFSLSREAGSILLNEGLVQYKGEDYEKVLINAMLAINYLALNNREDALVETRKVNDKLYKYKFEAKRDYEQNPYAFYLSAMIWEANRHWDDAYIDYKHTYDLDPSIPYLRADLMRLAKLSRRNDVRDDSRTAVQQPHRLDRVDVVVGGSGAQHALEQNFCLEHVARPGDDLARTKVDLLAVGIGRVPNLDQDLLE